MAADTLQVVKSFSAICQSLASDDGYKNFVALLDSIPALQKDVESKSAEIDRLRIEITSLQEKHKERLGEELELYGSQRNKLAEEKTKLSTKINDLEATISGKEKAVLGIQKSLDKVRGQHEQTQKLLEAEKKKTTNANTEILQLQKKLKEKQSDVEKFKEAVTNERNQASITDSQLKALSKKNSDLQEQLQTRDQRLKELEGFAASLQKVKESEWLSQLDSMWQAAQQFIESYFIGDLPQEKLENPKSWKKLRDCLQFREEFRDLPLPQSNSKAAKRMRTAAVLAVLARQINQQIFMPNYATDSGEEIRHLLVRLAVKDSKKEAFCRALLLSFEAQRQAESATDRVEEVVEEVTLLVQNMLPASQLESFKTGLEIIVQRALEVWKVAQHATEKFEPAFALDDLARYPDFHWKPIKFKGDKSDAPAPPADELLVIFPRIYSIEDQEPEPITPGVALMQSQIVEAVTELEQERRKQSSPTTGKPLQMLRSARRTNSISTSGGGGNGNKEPFLSKMGASNGH